MTILGVVKQVHTVIVDEGGCTPESSTALFLRLSPSNLILIGDHKQLRPTSKVLPQELSGTNHDCSLLERSILASAKVTAQCSLNHAECSLNHAECSLIAECSLNDAECSLNHADRSPNHADCTAGYRMHPNICAEVSCGWLGHVRSHVLRHALSCDWSAETCAVL
jgi:hypothetical protein